MTLRSQNVSDDHRSKARAEALFKKETRRVEGEKAMTEYQASVEAVRAKTARLRAQRLARDAVTQPTAKTTAKTTAKSTGKTAVNPARQPTEHKRAG